MIKLLSVKYSAGAFNTAMLLLRIVAGGLMLKIGYEKLIGFNEKSATFMNFMGMGPKVSLALVVFAEFFCSILVILGLLTRLACIPLIITMCVALFVALNGDVFGKGQTAVLFLTAYTVILLVGPGRASADGALSK